MKRADVNNGDKFGLLTIIQEIEPKIQCGRPYRQFLCKCDCGKEVIASLFKLKNGKKPSCGCQYGYHNIKHGDSHTRLYKIWLGMKNRCECVNFAEYHNYGRRGIIVCDEWHDYSNFRNWSLLNGYTDKLTIDRIDVNGNYCPENCRWITNYEQQFNKRNSVFITYKGITKHLYEWSKEFGVPTNVLRKRYKIYGVTDEIFTKEHFTKTNKNKNKIIKLYNEGLNYKEIAKIVGIQSEYISKAIERWELPHKSKVRDKNGKFK